MQHLSEYVKSLPQEAKVRYLNKIAVINGIDPLTDGVFGEEVDITPPVDACDLLSYLVLQTSFVTSNQFKARKGLEAYNQLVCGWVKEINTRKISNKYVTTDRVRHSQRLTETPLKCWVIIETTGEVCCGHCNCMAGLGEVCTHIAALLFYLEALHRIEEVETCTQQQCEWIIPSALKTVEYLSIKDIDFTSAQGKKRKLDELLEGNELTKEMPVSKSSPVPTDDEMKLFFRNLSCCGTKPAILSLIPDYANEYVPKISLPNFPQPLTSLQKPDYLKLNYYDLLNVCENVSIKITEDMAKAVELETRQQSKTNLWFKYRAGRVTASRMKAVCHTDSTNPSQSLVKSICYPDAFTFTSKQTNWGCKHEKQARERYTASNCNHVNLRVKENGLFINPLWPFIGASPDGIVNCDCCPKGVLEIKCPYCHSDETIKTAAADSKFCLKEENGQLQLDHSHSYYYQVQTQIFVCDVAYCDFCVCTFGTDLEEKDTIHIERIYKDLTFWNGCVTKAEHFFKTCLLPELLGNWYTRPTVKPSDEHQSSESDQMNLQSIPPGNSDIMPSDQPTQPVQAVQTYCYCQGPDSGEMIGCDNKDCSIEWFHLKCLKINATLIPKGKWYCPDCRVLPKFSKKSKGKAVAKSKK